ncbi:MAG: transcription antitermination factor NusB [Gemmatimonadota bacterium]
MNNVTPARVAALDIMRAIRSGELADRAFARQVDNVPARERPWLHELVYGTLRLRGRLAYILDQFVARGTKSLDDDVLDILRLAAYQLLEMDSVPVYAAVSQAVELTKASKLKSASGLVNGVLQSLRRAQNELKPPQGAALERLSSWGSHPRWLVERWLAQFGETATEQLIAVNNTRPSIYIRLLDGTSELFKLTEGSVTDALAKAPAIVQDPAASLVADYVAADAGVIADVCAAPGGKALAIASNVGERGVVIAADIAAARLERAIESRERVGIDNMHFVIADARRPAIKQADYVLVDAPCTGTGTFRRHPDGKWRVQPRDLAALVELQREILDATSQIVKIGGVLVYSTCSIEPEENQQQVHAFLERHPNFRRSPPRLWQQPALLDETGNLVVLPQNTGFDGAFAARLERAA